MKKLINNYVQSISLAFTFIWVVLAIVQVIFGGKEDTISLGMLQLIVLLAVLLIIDGLVWRLPFKRSITGYLSSATAQCLFFLGFGSGCGWFIISPLVLLDKVILFTIIYAGVFLYNYYLRWQEAVEINQILQKKMKGNKID